MNPNLYKVESREQSTSDEEEEVGGDRSKMSFHFHSFSGDSQLKDSYSYTVHS